METYKNKRHEYGQTILFAVNVVHAIQLTALFRKAGIKADYIVTRNIKDFSGSKVTAIKPSELLERL